MQSTGMIMLDLKEAFDTVIIAFFVKQEGIGLLQQTGSNHIKLIDNRLLPLTGPHKVQAM